MSPADAEAALKALANLSRLDSGNGKDLHKLGACTVVIQLLREYVTSNAYVTAQACYAVHALAKEVEANRDALCEAGVGKDLMKAMTAFPSHAEVAINCCWSLWNLANGSNARKDDLVSVGAITQVLQTILAFPANADVWVNGLGAIWNLGG